MANEALKIYPKIKHIVTQGNGLDLGCGPFKISDKATGVDPGGYDDVIDEPALKFLMSECDNQYDWVFASHFLEHDQYWHQTVHHSLRVLKPGGDLLIYLPDKNIYKNQFGKDPNAGHVNHWDSKSFIAELKDFFLPNDFEIVEVEDRNTTPRGHVFTGNGETEDPKTSEWEYGFFVHIRKN